MVGDRFFGVVCKSEMACTTLKARAPRIGQAPATWSWGVILPGRCALPVAFGVTMRAFLTHDPRESGDSPFSKLRMRSAYRPVPWYAGSTTRGDRGPAPDDAHTRFSLFSTIAL